MLDFESLKPCQVYIPLLMINNIVKHSNLVNMRSNIRNGISINGVFVFHTYVVYITGESHRARLRVT